MALLFPNSLGMGLGPASFNTPVPGLLGRARNWWNEDPDRQDRLRALFAGWAMGDSVGDSMGLGAQGMLNARREQRGNRDEQAVRDAILGMNGMSTGMGAFPTRADVERQRSGGLLNNPVQSYASPSVPPPASLGGGDYRSAISAIESGGRYNAIGPRDPELGRPLGKYQVMEANVGPWSQEVLGRRVSAEEFLASPQIQDAIFDGKFGGYVRQYGPEGAAQAWFGGPGSVGRTGRQDVLGTSVGEYGQRFMAGLGGSPAQGGQQAPVAGHPVQTAQAGPMPGVQVDQSLPWLNGTATPQTGGGTSGYSQRAQDILRIMMMPGAEAQMPVLEMMLKQELEQQDPQNLISVGQGSSLYDPNTGQWINPPQAQGGGNGLFSGTALDGQALEALVANGTLTAQQAYEIAAGRTVTDPQTGAHYFFTPQQLVGGGTGAPATTAAGGGASSAGPAGTQLTPGRPPTGEQARDGTFATRMESAGAILSEFEQEGTSLWNHIVRGVPLAGNYMTSPEYQRYEQAQRDFVNAQLRRESGAVINPDEFENARIQYFPQPGDGPDVIAQKNAAREIAIQNMRVSAGPAYRPGAVPTPTLPPSGGPGVEGAPPPAYFSPAPSGPAQGFTPSQPAPALQPPPVPPQPVTAGPAAPQEQPTEVYEFDPITGTLRRVQ